MQQPADEAKVEAAEREPKTSESAQGSKSYRRFTITTALISASAALLGALVGGISSYTVSQHNNIAEADRTQIRSRQAAYADYLTAEIDLEHTEYKLVEALHHPEDSDEVRTAVNEVNDAMITRLHISSTISLIGSHEVAMASKAIADKQSEIQALMDSVAEKAFTQIPLDQYHAELDKLRETIDEMSELQDLFIESARADMTPPKRGLFS